MKVRELVEEEVNGKKKLKEGKNVEWLMFLINFYPGYDLDMDVLDFIEKLIIEVDSQHNTIYELADVM